MFCPNCGKEAPNGAMFCDNCGRSMSIQPQPAQPMSQPADQQYPAPSPQYQNPSAQYPPTNGYPPQQPYPGAPYPPQQPYDYSYPPQKSPGVAAILALLIPGVGHIYDGKIAEGIIILVLSIVLGVLWWLIIPAIILFVLWIWQIFDAYNKANRYNQSMQQTGRAPW
jgi:TM2 domain-containing membrane protein YozV